jgi:hypothetical protein
MPFISLFLHQVTYWVHAKLMVFERSGFGGVGLSNKLPVSIQVKLEKWGLDNIPYSERSSPTPLGVVLSFISQSSYWRIGNTYSNHSLEA